MGKMRKGNIRGIQEGIEIKFALLGFKNKF